MRLLGFIITSIMMCVTLYASDISHKFSGNLEYYLIHCKPDLNSKDVPASIINKIDLFINNDFKYKNIELYTSIGYIRTDKHMYNGSLIGPLGPLDILYFNNLYLKYDINKNLNIRLGTFNFRKGTFYEYSFNGNTIGDGLFTIVSDTYQGGIVNYKNKVSSTSIGYVWQNKFYSNMIYQNDDINYGALDGSEIGLFIHKHKYNRWFTEFDYFRINKKLYNIDYLKGNLFGLGLSYDDEDNTGRVYYSIFSYSDVNGDNTHISPTGAPYEDSENYFGKFSSKGYSFLLGIKQELDAVVLKKDMVIGAEYGYTSPGYYNLKHGKPLEAYTYTNLGDTYKSYAGIRYTKNLLFKIVYCKYDNHGKIVKRGLTTVTGNTSDTINGARTTESLSFMVYYTF